VRTDPPGSRLTAPNREPRIVIGIIYPTGSIYVTNKTAAIANVPGNVVHGCLEDISSVSRELNPLEARSTIGGFSFTVTDVDGELTDELRAQLGAGEGVGRREVRVYTGDTDDFDDGTWSRVDTYVIDRGGVSYDRGSYRFSCSDRQRQLRERIFPSVTTRLVGDLSAAETTSCAVSSTAGFDLVEHTASFSDAPSATVGYFRIKKTGEIIRFTGVATAPTRFTGLTRERFGTVAQAVDVDPSADLDRQPEIELVYYLEMPAPQMAYALMTGVVLDTVGPIELPDGYHVGIDEDFALAETFQRIGTDLYDPDDLTAGLVLFFSSARGVRETDGKDFIEKQVLFPMWTFLQISNEGKFALRRLVRMLSNAAPAVVINEYDVMGHGALEHQVGEVCNRIIVRWNHDGDDFTRHSEFINAGSISAHGEGRTLEFDLYGIVVALHTRETLRRIFNSITDRYGAPPEDLDLELSARLNQIEVGDVGLVQLGGIRDFAGAGTLSRSFEMQSRGWNPRTGEVRVRGMASTSTVAPDAGGGTAAVLADAWYSSAGSALSSVLTIASNQVTANGTISGGADARTAVFYHAGNLTINAGVNVDIDDNVQLRILGTLTVNGTINGRGRGLPGDASPDFPTTPPEPYPEPFSDTGFFGVTRSGGSVYLLDQLYQEQPGVYSFFSSAVPRLNLVTVAGELFGLQSELRGVPGGYGAPAINRDIDETVAIGGDGGAGGAGLLLVCRGLVFGAAGEIDLSGADGSAAPATGDLGGVDVYGGGGAGGAPGALYVILDGDTVTYPDLTAALIAEQGASPVTGTPAEEGGPTGSLTFPAEPATGLHAGLSAADHWQASHLVQYVPSEIELGDGDDEAVPAPTTLAASGSDIGVQLTWVSPPADKHDFVEVWRATTNDRTGAVRIFKGRAGEFFDVSATAVTRYFWTRAGQDRLGYSAWHPTGSTSGVAATYGGANGLSNWTPILVNVSRLGSTFTKTSGGSAWNGSVYSQEGYLACAVSFRASQTNSLVMVGLNTDPTLDNDYASIDFALYAYSDGNAYIFENGSDVLGSLGAYTTSDQFTISYDGLRVRYYKNGTLLRTKELIGARLFLDSSFGWDGVAINSVSFGAITHVPPSGTGFAADAQGKPAGVRQGWSSASTPDRATLSLVNGEIRISATSAPTGNEFCLPAIPVDAGKTYQLTVQHYGTVASADGRYFRFEEYNAALPAGKTHIGDPGGSYEAVFVSSVSSTTPAANLAISTTRATETYSYTPTAGTKFVSLAFWNYQPNTTTDLIIAWATLTELGSDIDLLNAPTPTDGLTDLINPPVIRQSAAPSGALAGWIWVDTDDLRVYRYDGSSWVQLTAGDIELLVNAGVLASLDTVDTPQIEPEAATTVASATDASTAASASNTVDEQYAATVTLVVEATSDVIEVTMSGVATVTQSGSPGSPEASARLQYNAGAGWVNFGYGAGFTVPQAATNFAFTASITGLAAGSVDFALTVVAAESGGSGTVTNTVTNASLVATQVKR
jgi:hypothetical protein